MGAARQILAVLYRHWRSCYFGFGVRREQLSFHFYPWVFWAHVDREANCKLCNCVWYGGNKEPGARNSIEENVIINECYVPYTAQHCSALSTAGRSPLSGGGGVSVSPLRHLAQGSDITQVTPTRGTGDTQGDTQGDTGLHRGPGTAPVICDV